MSITMPWHMKYSKRTLVVDGNMFAARKCEIDPVRRSDHLSNPRCSLGVQTKAYAMIGDPLVVSCREKPIGILDDRSIPLTARQHHLARNLLSWCIAPVMIRIGMSIDRYCQ